MSETKQLPNRSDLSVEATWDLTPIFKDDIAFDEAYETLSKKLEQASQYQGTLHTNATAFFEAIDYLLAVYREVEKIYVYSHLKNDQDTSDTTYQALYARASTDRKSVV